MKKLLLIALLLIAWPAWVWGACVGPSQSEVQTAINNASVGDTVDICAGDATWAYSSGYSCGGYTAGICVNKGIHLRGGIEGDATGITRITFSGSYARGGIMIAPNADAITNAREIEVSGFNFNGNSASMGNEGLLSVSCFSGWWKKLKVHDNIFRNCTSKAIVVNGLVGGAIYENTFTDTAYSVTAFGGDSTGWNNSTQEYGTENNLFIEDNSISWTADWSDIGGTDHGQGFPGFVFRYNNYNLANTIGGWHFVIHGLQSMATAAGFNCPSGCGYESCTPTPVGSCDETVDSCYQWSTLHSEYYRNTSINGTSLNNVMAQRGGWLMMFDNSFSGTGSAPGLGYSQYACDSCQSPASPAYSHHVQNTYVWNNTWNGSTRIPMTKSLDGCADYSIGKPYTITQDVDYWNQNSNTLNGSTQKGINVGTLASIPSACSTGDGYFATDQGTWNKKVGGTQGVFYKCTSPNNWELYYTPYEYPHPLRGEGGDTTPPAAAITTNSGSNYSTSTKTINLAGTATDNVLVSSVTWACATCTPTSGSATNTGTAYSTWSITSGELINGANTITVTATDSSSNTGNDSIIVTYTPQPPSASCTIQGGSFK